MPILPYCTGGIGCHGSSSYASCRTQDESRAPLSFQGFQNGAKLFAGQLDPVVWKGRALFPQPFQYILAGEIFENNTALTVKLVDSWRERSGEMHRGTNKVREGRGRRAAQRILHTLGSGGNFASSVQTHSLEWPKEGKRGTDGHRRRAVPPRCIQAATWFRIELSMTVGKGKYLPNTALDNRCSSRMGDWTNVG